MKSFIINPVEPDISTRMSLIYDMCNTCLYNDELWHFFLEGEFGIYLRCDDESVEAVKNYLSKLDIKFTLDDYSKDDNSTVTAFMTTFISIFHNSSMLAMQFLLLGDKLSSDSTKERLLIDVVERTVHSMCNNSQFMVENTLVKKAVESYNEPEIWEAYLLNDIAMNRSMWGGVRHLYKQGWIKT